jgi:predicted Zn-dependent protease with MMP-like domain
MNTSRREQFDALLEAILDGLPHHLHELLEEVPLIVEDEPSSLLLQEMGMDRSSEDLCGLHWGVALTDRSVQASADMPDRIMLFRGPIIRLAHDSDEQGDFLQSLRTQINITLLHEIGHHFGLDEDDLTALGYG